MSEEVVLKIEHLDKVYRLGEIGTGTISHDLNRWWARVRGKEDPFSRVGVANDRTQQAMKGELVKVLNDINFEVKKGEVLGIIGKNGAGKSTLLKVISQITSPSSGSIKAKGRIASLLEVGTGMHPEMTGKENVYLNGTILGMTKKEIDVKYDEIMEFAGCAKYADTPVKRYSSGMKVRLGFAVAAFLEPEILIVDEVLAVGDAEFQSKAIGKMQDISSGGGRTVLFVSHNMGSLKSLCTRAILLDKGEVVANGDVNEVISTYISSETSTLTAGKKDLTTIETAETSFSFVSLVTHGGDQKERGSFIQSEDIVVTFVLKCEHNYTGVRINLGVVSSEGQLLFLTSSHEMTKEMLKAGEHRFDVVIPKNLLNQGKYMISLGAGIPGQKVLLKQTNVISVDLMADGSGGSYYNKKWPGLLCPKLDWKMELI